MVLDQNWEWRSFLIFRWTTSVTLFWLKNLSISSEYLVLARKQPKVIIHMQGKFPDIGAYVSTDTRSGDDEVIDSLIALGFSVVEAQTAVQSIPRDFSEDIEERLRYALQFFSTPRLFTNI